MKHSLKYFYAHDEGWEIKSGVGGRVEGEGEGGLTTNKKEGEKGRRVGGWAGGLTWTTEANKAG